MHQERHSRKAVHERAVDQTMTIIKTPRSPVKKHKVKRSGISLESVNLSKLKDSILVENPQALDLWNKPMRVQENSVVCGKYITGQVIGEGYFSIVYECLTDPGFCVKVEKAFQTKAKLDEQVQFHRLIAEKGFAPNVIAHD